MGIFIDPSALPDDTDGFIQILFLLVAYGYILMQASNLISDGSELLLLVPSLAGVVGSVVLPVLGAVPDGAIVLFSGMGPDAQSQLTVGVGALAGSTIMLLTIPWTLSIIGGRVNLHPVTLQPTYKRPHGDAAWSKLNPPDNFSLWHTGVSIMPPVRTSGLIMLLTAITYLFIQIPAFVYYNSSTSVLAHKESPWALVGLILAVISFAAYLVYQFRIANDDDVKNDLINEIAVTRIVMNEVSLLGVLGPTFRELRRSSLGGAGSYGSLGPGAVAAPVVSDALKDRIKTLVRPFFKKYDVDGSGHIEVSELALLFKELGETLTSEDLRTIFSRYDRDHSGQLDFEEFVDLVIDYGYRAHRALTRAESRVADSIGGGTSETKPLVASEDGGAAVAKTASDEHEDEDEEEEVPEDLKDLDWETQQFRIKLRSFYMMALGTALVLIFSDPMVEVLSEVGDRTGIPSFYISFVLSPLVSNASELIASYNYAQKKTSKTITISLATLTGAAIMNNTFVLGIFLILVYVKSLAWEYSAETISILFVELFIGVLAFRHVHTVAISFVILSLYPLSLVLVYVLENVIGLN